MKSNFSVIALIVLCGVLASVPANADGIDLIPWLTRVYSPVASVPVIALLVAVLMVVNYALNLLVIGLPAVKVGPPSGRQVAISLLWLTLFGQVADRVGAFLALSVSLPIADALNLKGEGNWVVPLFGASFVFSGLAVGALAFYFLRWRWKVAKRPSWIISVASAVLTNPTWALVTWIRFDTIQSP